jgi:hypothetical protein
MVVKNIAAALKRVGIKTAEYKSPPAGPEVFAITILNRRSHGHKRGVVTVNHGQAQIEMFGSPSRQQAAVTVREEKRQVVRTVKWKTSAATRPEITRVEAQLKGAFPIGMPSETEWKVEDVTITRGKEVRYNPGMYHWHCQGKVTATVANRSTNHFLIGMDETHHFISPLPKQATSVAMAHRLLRGKKVKEGTTRQGEWFFVPVDRKTARALDKLAIKARPQRLGSTTHVAKTAVRLRPGTIHGVINPSDPRDNDVIYARGFITDNRDGHHRSIFLKSWRRVERNKEVEMRISPAQAEGTAARRRMRSFD